MEHIPPVIVWFRRDLRLSDNPALNAAIETGQPVLAVFIRDATVDAMGAAAKWRLGLGLEQFRRAFEAIGGRLVLRHGAARDVLADLLAETGVREVFYNRDYTPDAITRDTALKADLTADGITVTSFNALLLFEPWTVEGKSGGFYRVFTPFWKSVRDRDVSMPLPAPTEIRSFGADLASDNLDLWNLAAEMRRGAAIVQPHTLVGEAAAKARLDEFLNDTVEIYEAKRDRMDIAATSGLSEPLAYGEISPRTIWHAGWDALRRGAAGAETFLKEVVWREFAYHLLFHTPHLTSRNWRPEWDAFSWKGGESDAIRAWKRGITGEPIVDAAMREMYVTGRMHNRTRMIVASYLTKHLLTDWRVGMDWFAECLTDWDPASNAMGWQWAAGCGPDAAPYFRVFNPATQAEKFDPDAAYRRRWLGRGEEAMSYFDAIPKSWDLGPGSIPAQPIIGLKEGRERALAAYAALKATRSAAE